MKVAERNDPYLSFRFNVEIEGLFVGAFSEVSGLQIEVETEEYKEGGVNDYVHKFPKMAKYQNLVLKKGITNSNDLWEWHQDVVKGIVKRRRVSIVLLDSTGNEKWRWGFEEAYPVKWTGPDLKADTNAVAVESLELCHNGIKKA